jgi:hypothetical protein
LPWHNLLIRAQVAAGISSQAGGERGGLAGECGGFAVVLAGGQAVVEADQGSAEEVALGCGVPVAGVATAVVVGAGAR